MAVPDCLKDLPLLEDVSLSGNKLTAVPDWMTALPKLRQVDLDGCPVAKLPANLDGWENASGAVACALSYSRRGRSASAPPCPRYMLRSNDNKRTGSNMREDWRSQLRHAVTGASPELEIFGIPKSHAARVHRKYPVKLTPYTLKQLSRANLADPLNRQALPSLEELVSEGYGRRSLCREDPCGVLLRTQAALS